mmetsp:Transcript_1397/g.2397  ORF Transcript_1397/g.2397 Transcript_1397/m.2397 type:complete len:926 (-) Transcript_1397:106-2883(-)
MKYFISNAAIMAFIVLLTDKTSALAPASGRAPTKFEINASCFGRCSSRVTIATLPDANKSNAWELYAHNDSIDENELSSCRRRRLSRLREVASRLKRKSKPATFALATAAGFLSLFPGQSLFRPPAVLASAPIVLRKSKPKDDPPIIQAMKKAEELKKKQANEEFDKFMRKCIEIEESEGKQARAEYEKQYNIEKEKKEAQKAIDVENLKRDLLDEGKDPNTDMEGENEVWKFEHGVDLAKVAGTRQNEQMIREFQSRGKDVQSFASQRYIVKCQVADLKARGIDPLAHFSEPEVIDKTRAIYKMDDKVAAKVAKKYEELMEEHGGRLTPAQVGEKPFVRSSGDQIKEAASKVAAKDLRSDAKAKRVAEKEAQRKAKADAKAQAKADRAAAKEKKLVEKTKAKEAVAASTAAAALAAKEAAAVSAATSAAHQASDSEIAATAQMDFAAAAGQEAVAPSSLDETRDSGADSKNQVKVSAIDTIKSKATIGNVAPVLIGGGAAVYGFNYFKENNSGAQSEREKQLRLILGGSFDDDDEDESETLLGNNEDDEKFDGDDDDDDFAEKKSPNPPQSTPESPKEPKSSIPTSTLVEELPTSTRVKPKRKLGIFSKKKANARETDLNKLVAPGAQAPEFAELLAKILTFGAPGRFPAISKKGDMPFEEFDLEKAKSMLEEARSELDLTEDEMAEMFASVVNCMIIDIVDLASSTLNMKDKDEKVTVDAVNVVMDFMDHAASLFDSVAKDVTITPVTYGGNLGKKQLEQMFSVYASSSIMSLDGSVSQDRVDTLQLVFGITDKKAEGLMQKHMMKMMMKMMKDPEAMKDMPGMEGMEEMMAAMGGGMPGMPGMDGEMSPEDLKEVVSSMKELMDSGQVSDEELAEVRKQFKEMYGSDISDLIKKAEQEGAGGEMGEDEKELLDMFKRILGDD